MVYMKWMRFSLLGFTCAALLSMSSLQANAQPQVLVTIGDLSITSDQLKRAVASSPFATQFVGMEQDDQAMLRGDMLRRLVVSQLLYLEALDQGLDQQPAFQAEMEKQRLGLLYRHYMDKLRERIEIPPETLRAMKQQLRGNSDALAGAKAAFRSKRYRTLRLLTLKSLREKAGIKLYEERIRPGILPDTVLLEGKGMQILYGDIVDPAAYQTLPNPEWVKEQLYRRAELLLIAQVAEAEGVDVSERLASYRKERLPALMMEVKIAEWIPDEKTLREWYDANPGIGRLLERRHIGQLVVATRKEAEMLRQRIVAGESLFDLARQYSIDPYSREHNGDMGWIKEGRGLPQLEQVLADLQDGQISDVIETPNGFHIVTILERRPGGVRGYGAIRDKVRQLLIQERSGAYFSALEGKYKVVWNLIDGSSSQAITTKE